MRIEQATERDVDVISVVLGEIAAYYGGKPTPGDPEQIRRALFGERPVATVLLARDGDGVLDARDGDGVLGFASYTFLWPASGAGTSLFLKELYVRESARRRGVAGALMEGLKAAAVAAGCSRVEWTADTDNPPALEFYKALGAVPRDGKVFYRVTL
ncbi:GNAT family N-acetyltransferase [Streptomyces sp. ISL-66]|uniref:GNAT family N-acetyltransferase n=1 Tax=Streptomyces sp. ISL-66 TaxID=2819186 RepID=UPI001BE5132B|nr:GNAT family N-acetyltransferase [Streptomyces sp. ISL-66]MBT2468290.1 GNAT family N-acetyltransferase [Streptomyces sp. ISL-66]